MNVAVLLTKVAFRCAELTAWRHGDRRLSYAEFDAAVSGSAGWLAARYGRGDRVVLYLQNSLEYPMALFALFRAGLVAVPVNVKLHPREVAYIVENCCARAIVLDAEVTASVAAVIPPGVEVISVGQAQGARSVEELIAYASVAGDAEVAPTDLAWIFYTSGTTGRPKGAMLSHRNLLAMTISTLADVYRFEPEDIVLHAAPLSHGSGVYMLATIACGCTNIINDAQGFDPDAVTALIERERVTAIAFVAPTMIVRLLDAPTTRDTSSLRCVIYGGAPIHVDHSRAAVDRFGPIFVQIYGQGEAPMTISCLRARDHLMDDPAVLSSAGTVRTDVELKIVGDDGAPLPVCEIGEIAVRGDVVMSGYWNDPIATAKALRDGWLYTGDIGRLDPAGRVVLLDRKYDTIISGGINIYPREIEDVLVRHPAVDEAVVFGTPDPVWGENVTAAVVLVAGGTADAGEIVEFCKAHLASFKKPKIVHFLPELPRNAYGKVLRRDLRERFSQESPARLGQ